MSNRKCFLSQFAVALLLASACQIAVAQPQADLSLELAVDPAVALYPPGSDATLRFTITNHGPDTAPGASLAIGVIHEGPNAQVGLGPAAGASLCEFSVLHIGGVLGFHSSVIPQLQIPEMVVGASIDCELVLHVVDTARGVYPLQALVTRSAAHEAVDPDETNNHAAFEFAITTPDAPAPVTDLSVALDVPGGATEFPPGSNTEVLIQVFNAGPDVAPGSTLQVSVNTAGGAYTAGLVTATPGPGEDRCILVRDPSAPRRLAEAIQFPQLAAGASATCRTHLLVFEGASGSVRLTGNLEPQADFGLPTFDPALTNNSISLAGPSGVPVASPVRTIPASGTWALVLLSLMLLLTLSRFR